MSSTTRRDSWIGSALINPDGRRLGTIEDIYRHAQSGRAQWVVVRVGRFGSRRSFVPLADARRTPEGIVTPYSKSQIASAPKVDAEEQLRDEQVIEMYRHYDLPHDELVDTHAAEPTPRDRVIGYLEHK